MKFAFVIGVAVIILDVIVDVIVGGGNDEVDNLQ